MNGMHTPTMDANSVTISPAVTALESAVRRAETSITGVVVIIPPSLLDFMGAGAGIEPASRDYKTRIVTTGTPRQANGF